MEMNLSVRFVPPQCIGILILACRDGIIRHAKSNSLSISSFSFAIAPSNSSLLPLLIFPHLFSKILYLSLQILNIG